MISSYIGISIIPDEQMENIRGGMFGPFVNTPFNPAAFAPKRPIPAQPPVTQGLGHTMVKGAVHPHAYGQVKSM